MKPGGRHCGAVRFVFERAIDQAIECDRLRCRGKVFLR